MLLLTQGRHDPPGLFKLDPHFHLARPALFRNVISMQSAAKICLKINYVLMKQRALAFEMKSIDTHNYPLPFTQ